MGFEHAISVVLCSSMLGGSSGEITEQVSRVALFCHREGTLVQNSSRVVFFERADTVRGRVSTRCMAACVSPKRSAVCMRAAWFEHGIAASDAGVLHIQHNRHSAATGAAWPSRHQHHQPHSDVACLVGC